MQVCHYLADLISHDVVIRYKLELALSGRVDGISHASIHKRLESLQAYRAAFHGHQIPTTYIRMGTVPWHRFQLTSNGCILGIFDGVLTLWRPADAFSGLNELKFKFPHGSINISDIRAFTVDLSQDLFIYIQAPQENQYVSPTSTFVRRLTTWQSCRMPYFLTEPGREPPSRSTERP